MSATPQSTRAGWFVLATSKSVARRALKMAIVVGLILAAINHGDSLVTGSITTTQWLKIALTFLVPYCVSTASSVAALRGRDANRREPD